MLEVLDPEQNTTASATTISACRSICSRVVFIATANMLDTIPGPLRDRMEIIELTGYTEAEKLRDRPALPACAASSRRTA